MMSQIRAALGLAAAVMFLNMTFACVACAQDVMQLDLAFKNGQWPTSQGQGTPDLGGRSHDVGAVQEPGKAVRRHPKRRRR